MKLNEEEENLESFEPLAAALMCEDLILDKFVYEGSGNDTAWGPSVVKYPLALDRGRRRQKILDESLSSNMLVAILAPFCGQSANGNMRLMAEVSIATVKDMKGGDKETESQSETNEDQELNDTQKAALQCMAMYTTP